MSSFSVLEVEPTSLSKLISRVEGKPVKLEVIVEHDERNHRILFTLDRHLPGERDRDIFIYNGVTVLSTSAVKNPRVSMCETLSVRAFLNNLLYERQIEVRTFSLLQTELKYGQRLGYDRAVQIFINLCASALSIGENEAILVLSPRGKPIS